MFSEKQAVPVQVLGRILRWAKTLARKYYFDLLTNIEMQMRSVDYQAQLRTTAIENEVPAELVLLLDAMKDLPLTAVSIQDWMRKDPTLS